MAIQNTYNPQASGLGIGKLIQPAANPQMSMLNPQSTALMSMLPQSSAGTVSLPSMSVATPTVSLPKPVTPAPSVSPAPTPAQAPALPPVQSTAKPTVTLPPPPTTTSTPAPSPVPAQTPAPTQSLPQPTPAVTTPDASTAARDALQSQLVSLSAPTEAENALQLQLTEKESALQQLEISAQQATSDLEGQGRGIPLQLIRGQQAKLQGQALLKAQGMEAEKQTLLQKLASEQAKRSLQQQSVQMQLETAKQKLEEEQKAQLLAAQQNAPIEIGGSLVRLNPATGQYESVYTSPTQKDYASGSIGEYQFYAEQEKAAGRTPKSFSDYQTEDANRKALASSLAGQNGLTPQQTQNFIHITDKFQADEIMKNATSGQQAMLVADQVIADPNNATNQLKSLYTLVKSLDPNSAVREGEVGLAEKTQSYLQNFQASLTRISTGQTVDPAVAVQLAQASKDLAQAWFTTAQGREKQYAAQAQVAGVGNAFQQYTGSYTQPYANSGSGGSDPNDTEGLFSSDLSTSVNGSNIVPVEIGGKKVSVDKSISQPLAMADQAFFNATGKHIQINEALRSHDRQKQLYEAYKSGSGVRAAAPGKSFHETGKAVDVGNWKEAQPYLNAYGFKNPLADDKNHFSIGEFLA